MNNPDKDKERFKAPIDAGPRKRAQNQCHTETFSRQVSVSVAPRLANRASMRARSWANQRAESAGVTGILLECLRDFQTARGSENGHLTDVIAGIIDG